MLYLVWGGGFCPNCVLYQGDSVRGDFVQGTFCPGGILSVSREIHA